MTKESALLYRKVLELGFANLTDEQALQLKPIFPNWKSNYFFIKGQRIRYMGKLFKVLVNHTSNIDNTPDKDQTLYMEVI